MCGGTPQIQALAYRTSGLSPRVRGNRGACLRPRNETGSIPACAGEPALGGFRRSVISVYPRVCGGTAHQYPGKAITTGLSPRVRGNPPPSPDTAARPRSIPACAGEPNTSLSRGGNYGLSPRVRGNRQRTEKPRRHRRSIPACAGEPAPTLNGMPVERVYPRVCGGTALRRAARGVARGLSPRVRGNPPPRTVVLATAGSIPACAGEPHCCPPTP